MNLKTINKIERKLKLCILFLFIDFIELKFIFEEKWAHLKVNILVI